MYSGIDLPEKNIKSQITSAVNIIIQASRLQDGSRKITSVSELTGMEGMVITMQEIFRFEQTGVENGKVVGSHVSTGIRPRFVDKLKENNLSISLDYFNKEKKHSYFQNTPANSNFLAPSSASPQSSEIKNRLMNPANPLSQRLQK
jgi:hypothetical protein